MFGSSVLVPACIQNMFVPLIHEGLRIAVRNKKGPNQSSQKVKKSIRPKGQVSDVG